MIVCIKKGEAANVGDVDDGGVEEGVEGVEGVRGVNGMDGKVAVVVVRGIDAETSVAVG